MSGCPAKSKIPEGGTRDKVEDPRIKRGIFNPEGGMPGSRLTQLKVNRPHQFKKQGEF